MKPGNGRIVRLYYVLLVIYLAMVVLFEELHNLWSSPQIISMITSRRMKWAWHVSRMGEKRIAYKVLVGKSEGKRQFERCRCPLEGLSPRRGERA
jgi:hypothetical protein